MINLKDRERTKQWKKDHPERVRELNRDSYYKNHEQNKKLKRKSCKKYYGKNKEKEKQRTAEYRENHPDKYKALSTIRGHKRRGFIVYITASELEKLLRQTKFCPQCGKEFSKPRFKTVDRIDNAKILIVQTVQIICLKCNMKNSRRRKD